MVCATARLAPPVFTPHLKSNCNRDVNTPFLVPLPAALPHCVGTVSLLHPRLDCAASDSAIIVTERQGPRSSTLFHEYCRLAPDDRPPTRAAPRRGSAALARRTSLGLSKRAGIDQTFPGCARTGRMRGFRKRERSRLFLLCTRRAKGANRRALCIREILASDNWSTLARRNALLDACDSPTIAYRSATHAVLRTGGSPAR